MKHRILFFLIAAACAFGARATEAGTVQGNVQVSVTVVAVCLATTSPVNFGNVQLTGQATASGQIVVQCNGQVPFTIALNAGQHYNGSWRGVAYGTERVSYGLFAPSGLEWGDTGYEGTYTWGAPVTGTGSGSPQPFVVSGVLYPGTTLVTPGPYSDIVKVSLYF